VTAVAARGLERALRFAAKHRIPRAYDSYAQLLADPNIDVVYIAVPNGLHGRWIKAALAAGNMCCARSLCAGPLPAHVSMTVSPRRMVPPLTTNA
jgi:hypothetical protein